MGIITTALIFSIGLTVAYGSKCEDISGSWENELGSRMILNLDASNRISGEYYTAVETDPGAAAFVSNITGLFSRQNDGSLLVFSVLFNHGASLTSWVGQCTVCEDKEVLHTTYKFRKYVPDYQRKWAAVIVNQNTFWRLEDEAVNSIVDSSTTKFSPLRTLSVVSQQPPGGLELKGKWKSNNKEEIEFFGLNGDVLEGKHHATDLIGRKDGNDRFTAVALMSASNKRIRSWTGHIYNTFGNIPQTLETSWLEHEFSPSCEIARNAVKFGTQNFTRIIEESENLVNKSETFLDKIRKFFSSMF